MRNVIFLIILCSLISCSKDKRITITDLLDKDGLLYNKEDSTLYTGWIYVFDKNGKVKERNKINNGKFIGESITYYDNGQVESKGKLVEPIYYYDGRASKNGTWLYWYKNGKIKQIEHWFKSRVIGTQTRWRENGSLESETIVESDSIWKSISYYENGQKESEQVQKINKLFGLYRAWYDNGQIKLEENWKDGNLEGIKKTWNKDGSIESIEVYKNGNKISEKHY